jgi:hypothetical protein
MSSGTVGANQGAGLLQGGAAQVDQRTPEQIKGDMAETKAQADQQRAAEKFSRAISTQSSMSSLLHNLMKEIIGNFPKR